MNANTKWQLLIFDEVVRSKLLYGLETIQLTGAMLKKIDAFQIRCLKRILRIPSTFTDRQNPNRVVLQRCTEILYQNQGDQREFELFSRSYHRRKSRSLGHVLRSRDEDPMRQVSFQPSSAMRVQYGKKRVARGKIGCIMLNNMSSGIFFVVTNTMRQWLKTRGYIMQP